MSVLWFFNTGECSALSTETQPKSRIFNFVYQTSCHKLD